MQRDEANAKSAEKTAAIQTFVPNTDTKATKNVEADSKVSLALLFGQKRRLLEKPNQPKIRHFKWLLASLIIATSNVPRLFFSPRKCPLNKLPLKAHPERTNLEEEMCLNDQR